MAYQMAATAVTLKVIRRLQAFSNAIRRTFVQHSTRFQLTVCSHGPSVLAELLVTYTWLKKAITFSRMRTVITTRLRRKLCHVNNDFGNSLQNVFSNVVF